MADRLSDLTARLNQHAQGLAQQPEMLDYFRRSWSRLGAEQRLSQARAVLPDNAGPLNSQALVHRALATMRELSPAYFEHFSGYLDELFRIEQANEALEIAAAAARRPARPRR
jgi:hypothetical protein